MMQQLKDKISSLFYSHGLLCASHPFTIISLSILVMLIFCYPLTNFPLQSNTHLEFVTPLEGYQTPPTVPPPPAEPEGPGGVKRPMWYIGAPHVYIQQIVVKAAVSPWEPKRLIQTDAFRAPLSKAFDLLQDISQFQYKERGLGFSVSDICLHVSESLHEKRVKGLVPEYKCLIVSPTNFWGQDRGRFNNDGEIIKTIFNSYGPSLDTPPSIREILFGMPMTQSGVKRFYIRNRQRVISYAITLVLDRYNPHFIASLQAKLQQLYPLSQLSNSSNTEQVLVHMHYKDTNFFVEYTPLIVAYVVLFLYIYFSVRKIEMVKSKWGLALSAVVTVSASLAMSVSLCLTFAITPTLKGSEIFPYLVVIIGLENILVVTKSVVSTPVHLDVKLRVAQGLSKEGWYIFKYFFTELFIFTVGFLTFVPAIQEFCLFAVVGLFTDFFLQMFFFTTILSIDIRRMELSDLHSQSVQVAIQQEKRHPHENALVHNSSTFKRSRSGPALRFPASDPSRSGHQHKLLTPPPSPTSPPILGSSQDMFFSDPAILKLPRRVRLLNFWARTRFVQKSMIFLTVVWIGLIAYKAGLVEHLTQINTTTLPDDHLHSYDVEKKNGEAHIPQHSPAENGDGRISMKEWFTGEVDEHKQIQQLLIHEDFEMWRKLLSMHWPTLLGYYNITVLGKYISILPSMHLSMTVSPDDAIAMRHPMERKVVAKLPQRPDLVMSYHGDSNLSMESNHSLSRSLVKVMQRLTVYPRNKVELAVTVLLGLSTFVMFFYFILILYRCMCSRNYHKWRASWHRHRKVHRSSPYYKQIRESVPLVLEGHFHEVECLVTDGPLVVSTCLGGQLRVWDSTSGDCLTVVQRRSATPPMQRKPIPGRNIDDSDADLYEEYHGDYLREAHRLSSQETEYSSLSAPPCERPPRVKLRHQHRRNRSADLRFTDLIPDLSETIDTDFSTLAKDRRLSSGSEHSYGSATIDSHALLNKSSSSSGLDGFDFNGIFEERYREHRQMLAERDAYMRHKRRSAVERRSETEVFDEYGSAEDIRQKRSYSTGDNPGTVQYDATLNDDQFQDNTAPAVWCLACQDNLVIAGCGNGRIEFWDALTGQLKCIHHDSTVGVTTLCFVANRLMAARLTGVVDFFELELFLNISTPAPPTPPSTYLQHRGHVRYPSTGAGDIKKWDGIIHCVLLCTQRAHQRPINLLQTEGGRVVTGSQDRTLKVYRLEDALPLYTLHGHSGGITALFLDKFAPLAAISGSDDGTIRVWDLLTGACVHKLEGHAGTVTSLVCTALYIISAGMDDRLCIWERCKGHLIHWVQMETGFCNSLAMLTSNLMVTGGQGCLYLWDVSKGDVLRSIPLGHTDQSVFVQHLQSIGNSTIVCDYGNQLRVVHFPSVLEKSE